MTLYTATKFFMLTKYSQKSFPNKIIPINSLSRHLSTSKQLFGRLKEKLFADFCIFIDLIIFYILMRDTNAMT